MLLELLLLLFLAVIPVLCTGCPYFLFTLNRLFQSLCLALLSHATTVPVCMCVTHHLPFYWFWNLLPFLSALFTAVLASGCSRNNNNNNNNNNNINNNNNNNINNNNNNII